MGLVIKKMICYHVKQDKCNEGDSCPRNLTGIRRHRLRALFEGVDKKGTLRSRPVECAAFILWEVF